MPTNSDKKISQLPAASSLELDDLLAVVHDGVTSRITLRDLIKELNIDIPQPRIKIRRDTDRTNFGHDQVYASWEGGDNRFLKHKPEFWLYRYKKAALRSYINKEDGKRVNEWRKKRFVHPSHQHGANYGGERLFGGGQIIQINGQKNPIPSRNTEWGVDDTAMLETELDLKPWTYFRVKGMDEFAGIAPDTFPYQDQLTPRGTGSAKSRFVVFKVRIAINNPDEHDTQNPKLFGPFSETFILYPYKRGNLIRSMKYFLGPEASPQLRQL